VRMKALQTLAFLAASLTWQAHAQSGATPPYEAGKHYTVLETPQPTSTTAGKVEVAEVFMFGCPGCYMMEPRIQAWLATKPDYVNFVRVPAPWNPPAIMHARAYYAAEALGKLPAIEAPFFDEIHKNRNYLETEEKLATFFAAHGVDAAAFKTAFNSAEVAAKVKRAEELIGRYRVESTPTVVVNGKYVTQGRMAGTYEAWFAIIEDLAARENAAAR